MHRNAENALAVWRPRR